MKNIEFIDSICILDTSAILHKNSIIEDSIKSFKKVYIPKVVANELDYQKDKKNKEASIAISTINKFINKIHIEDFHYKKNPNEKNDDIIVKYSEHIQKKHNLNVYIINNDKGFIIRTKDLKNIISMSLDDYEIENRKIEYNSNDTTKLLDSVLKNDISSVIKLREIIMLINAFYSDGTTPLIKSVENNNIDMLKELIKYKNIEIDLLDNKKYKVSALSYAVFKKNINIADILVSNGARADKGGKGKNENNTPFLISCWDGWLKGVEYFSNIKNFSLNHTDKNGFTGLIKAVIKDNLNIVNFLSSCGKNVDFYIRCFNGKNAMEYCLDNKKRNTKNSNEIYNIIGGHYD